MSISSQPNNTEQCLVCQRTSTEVPLIDLRHQGQAFWICPQHLPVLIHHPEQLSDRLPGAANLSTPADH